MAESVDDVSAEKPPPESVSKPDDFDVPEGRPLCIDCRYPDECCQCSGGPASDTDPARVEAERLLADGWFPQNVASIFHIEEGNSEILDGSRYVDRDVWNAMHALQEKNDAT